MTISPEEKEHLLSRTGEATLELILKVRGVSQASDKGGGDGR